MPLFQVKRPLARNGSAEARVCFSKVLSNAQEAMARDARLMGVVPESADAELFDVLRPVPVVDALLRHQIAVRRGLAVDQSCNLGKGVTLE